MSENMSEVCFSIGDAAGHVYKLLEKGESNLANMKITLKKSGFDSQIVLMAIGWLAREEKIFVQKKGNTCIIKLK